MRSANWLKMPAARFGANALLARVGALYHDIGKVAAPDHFVENQSGDNPHDRLKPIQSAKIITSHVTYGLRMAKEIGLPKRIADFIPQHHGTRTLHFFLRKAEAQSNGAAINEADFRYPGPKPQFKEAAILMLVDSAEAAARSLAHPNPENIRAIVARIFDAVLSDGQLDESNLTLRELSEVREAIVNSLMAIYHPRIVYPDSMQHCRLKMGKRRHGLPMNELTMSQSIHRVKSKTRRFRTMSPEVKSATGNPPVRDPQDARATFKAHQCDEQIRSSRLAF